MSKLAHSNQETIDIIEANRILALRDEMDDGVIQEAEKILSKSQVSA